MNRLPQLPPQVEADLQAVARDAFTQPGHQRVSHVAGLTSSFFHWPQRV
jgi:hypothetical protein